MAESLHVLMTNIERSISNLTQEFKRVQSLVWNQTKPEECDAASTVSTDGGNLMTPSTTASEASDTTTRGEDMTVTVLPVEFGPPEKGKTYIIRTRNDKKVLTILKGDLQVVKGYAFGGWLWECSDWNGWYRFRNCTSGEYLGIDGDELAARPVSLTAHFTPRYRADGGYILLYKYYEVLHTVCCQDDGSRLARSGETAVWEFIEAKYPPIAEFPY